MLSSSTAAAAAAAAAAASSSSSSGLPLLRRSASSGLPLLRRSASSGLPLLRLPRLPRLRRPDALRSLTQLEVGPPQVAESARERHLPLTKASLVRLLAKDAGQAGGSLQQLAESLDNAIAHRFYGGLRDLQQIYRPLNPDDNTKDNCLSRRDRLDGEFAFLQRLSEVLRLSHFRELSAPELAVRLRPRASSTGVTVSVDVGKYDVLRVWVIGSTEDPEPPAGIRGLLAKMRTAVGGGGGGGVGGRTYQRVVLAVRLRTSDRLAVKMFRNVEEDAVSMLLPQGQLLMSTLDRCVIGATLSLGSAGLLFGFYAWQQHLPYVDWSCLATCLALAGAFRGLVTYKERKARHLTSMSGLLFHNCLASNRQLLPLLTERAEDEALKEAVLCYALLRLRASEPALLEQAAQDWAKRSCGADVDFDCEPAVDLLRSLGLVVGEGEGEAAKLSAIPLQQALAQLPSRPPGAHWLLTDQSDAFEKDAYALLVDRERRRDGWR